MGLTELERPATAGWRKTFLRRLGQHGSPTRAAREAGISLQRACQVRQRSGRFAEAWVRQKALARRRIVDEAEEELRRRGVEGWKEPVYQGGVKVGTKPKHSDACLVRLLEANSRKYARRSEGSGGGSTTVNVAVQLGMLADPVAVRLACELDARLAQGAEPQGLPAPEGG